MNWLNGWPVIGKYAVLIGAGVHCIGYGKSQGTTCVVIPDDYTPPAKPPDWPFQENECPICELTSLVQELKSKIESPEDKLTQRLLALKKPAE